MRISLVVFICLLFHSCTPLIGVTYNSSSGNSTNTPTRTPLITNNVYSDWYNSFLEEGEKKIRSDYNSMVSEKSDGNFVKRVFFPDTKTMTHYNEYQDKELSVKDGPEKVWTDLGSLTSSAEFVDGKEAGIYHRYNRKTGKLVSEGNFSMGLKEGLWQSFTPDGMLEGEINYEKGKREGKAKFYNEDGEISVKTEYRADTIYNTQILKPHKNMFPLKRSEQMPMFGDGCPEVESYEEQKSCSQMKLLQTVYKNLRYPPMAREYGLQGMAIVGFIVDETGSISDIHVIRGLNQEITEEITRVVKLLDTWVPGMQDGEPVKVQYTLPIRFKLE